MPRTREGRSVGSVGIVACCVGVLLATGCTEAMTGVPRQATAPSPASIAISSALDCVACIVPPRTLVRGTGQPVRERITFAADTQASHALVLIPRGARWPELQVTLNGNRLDLPALPPTDTVRLPIEVKATNVLELRLAGVPGSGVIVEVLGGTAVVGPAGGQVTAENTHAVVRVAPGTLARELTVSALEASPSGATHVPLTATGTRTLLPIDPASLTGSGAVDLRFPLAREIAPGARAIIHSTFAGIAGDYWSPPVSDGDAVQITMSGAALAELARTYAIGTFDVVHDVQQVQGSASVPGALDPSSSSTHGSVSAPARPRASATGATRSLLFESVSSGCQQTPGGITRPYSPCNAVTLRRAGNAAHAPSAGRYGIVLVHGWSLDIGDWMDFYRAQGISCGLLPFATDVTCSDDIAIIPSPELPGDVYFETLLPLIESRLPDSPVYYATYESFNSIALSGSRLAAALRHQATQDGLAGWILVGHSMGGLVARMAADSLLAAPEPGPRVGGIVTLGTPHQGTSAPLEGIVASVATVGPFLKGIPTDGARDLVSVRTAYPGARVVPMIMHAGDIEHRPLSFDDAEYNAAAAQFCIEFLECVSDGVVPVGSALAEHADGPLWVRRPAWRDYDHHDLITGRTSSAADDPELTSVVNDVASFIPPSPRAPVRTSCPGALADGYFFAPAADAFLSNGALIIPWKLKGPYNDGRKPSTVMVTAWDASCGEALVYLYKQPALLGPDDIRALTPGETNFALRLERASDGTGVVTLLENGIPLVCTVGCRTTPMPATFLGAGYSYSIYLDIDGGGSRFRSDAFTYPLSP